MCGICGIINKKEERVSVELLHSMNECLLHRGPDASGTFVGENVGLAMRRLSIIDLSTGAQPHYNETRTVVCICNGEIYNFQELRTMLRSLGHDFHTQSDVEVIPHLYEQYGDSFPKYLKGMFAIALYDLTARKLVLARDRGGEKPLYYSTVDGNFYFASEIKSLKKIPRLDRRINSSALYSYFRYRYIPAPETVYEVIHKLSPASILVLRENGPEISKYWDVDAIRVNQKLSAQDAQDQLHGLLKRSVFSQMISDVPLGAFLSGGVDSSIVVALMQQQSTARIKTFSIKFPEKSYDESMYARTVANHLGTDHTEFEVDWKIRDSIIPIIRSFDEPFADSSSIPVYYLSRLTKEKVTVALSGDGGDELFGGYSRYKGMELALRYSRVPFFLRAPFEKLIASFLRDSQEKIEVSVRRKLLRFLKFNKEIMGSKNTFLPSIDTSMMRSVFSADFYRQVAGAAASKYDFDIGAGRDPELINRMMRHDFKYFLPDDILTKVDRMSMFHSLETRAPFLDNEVIEFAYSLPARLKISNGVTKSVLKRAFEKDLPRDILYRQKQGFVVPLAKWFKSDLKDYLTDFVLRDNDPFFDRTAIKKLLDQHVSGARDNADILWTIFCFSVWSDNNT